MGKYRKKPVVINAVQFTGDVGTEEITALDLPCAFDPACNYDYLVIRTLEGEMRANPGDWIIRGVKGELYPCKPDIFEATYEPATTPTVIREIEGASPGYVRVYTGAQPPDADGAPTGVLLMEIEISTPELRTWVDALVAEARKSP